MNGEDHIESQAEEPAGDQALLKATALCPECPAGVMRLTYITYFTWLNGELITVPNFPAWVCDMCGRRTFDSRAITWLNTLLNPSAGRSSASQARRKLRRRTGRSGLDRPQP